MHDTERAQWIDAQMLEALRQAFPILVRLAEQQRQERGGSGLMEGTACNTAEYLAYCSVRAAIRAAEAPGGGR